MSVVYDYFGGLYINLTNRCPCRCEFCIKNFTNSLGSADSLMLDHEPTVDEVKEELTRWDPPRYDEVVFCGYGEPTERLDELIELAGYIHDEYGLPTRLNTIGLADLIWGKETLPLLAPVIDSISISLNEADAEGFDCLCHPRFGTASYEAVCRYIEDARRYIDNVAVSVVGGSITPQALEECRAKATDWGVEFKVR